MRKLLTLISHILFIAISLLLVNIFVFKTVSYDSFRGTKEYEVETGTLKSDFKQSSGFDTVMGQYLSDIISYGSILNYQDSESFKLSVSGNSLSNMPKDTYNSYSDAYEYADYLNSENTNIRYFIIQNEGKGQLLYTNLETKENEVSALYDTLLISCDKYLYSDAGEHLYETNTEIEESTVYYLFNKCDYPFYDDTKIMVGVIKDPLIYTDSVKFLNNWFNYYNDYFFIRIIGLIIFGFAYICILIYLCSKKDEHINVTDYIPSEIRILLLILLGIGINLCIKNYDIIKEFLIAKTRTDILQSAIIVAVPAFIASIFINVLLVGMINRINHKMIIKTSLIGKLLKKIYILSGDVYENAHDISKAYVPYLIFALINVAVTYLAVKFDILYILLGIFIIDIGFGYVKYRSVKENHSIYDVIINICNGDIKAKVDEESVHGDNKKLAKAVNQIGDSVDKAVSKSMKDEKTKADLITNVSHDLKTPLTSIINYVDLLKKEDISNENALNYINILEEKSYRLKALTDDLVEASKISSGNITLEMIKLNLKEFTSQFLAEIVDRMEERNLEVIASAPTEDIFINADSKSIYRVFENLFTNIYKYALPNTRVYLDIAKMDKYARIQIKNISASPLNIEPEELTDRFVRGDSSRTSEGSGLGLSIAKSLTEKMDGMFTIELDGDLFKVNILLKLAE